MQKKLLMFFVFRQQQKNQEQHDDPELLNALFERTTMITLRPVPAIILRDNIKFSLV